MSNEGITFWHGKELSVELSVSGYYTKSQVIILFEHNDEWKMF